MAKEKVTVNVSLTVNEYDRFTFKESLKSVKKGTARAHKIVVPYAFPLNTGPRYYM